MKVGLPSYGKRMFEIEDLGLGDHFGCINSQAQSLLMLLNLKPSGEQQDSSSGVIGADILAIYWFFQS